MLDRIRVESNLGAVADCEVVVEAIVEQEAAKVDPRKRLDAVVKAPDAISA